MRRTYLPAQPANLDEVRIALGKMLCMGRELSFDESLDLPLWSFDEAPEFQSWVNSVFRVKLDLEYCDWVFEHGRVIDVCQALVDAGVSWQKIGSTRIAGIDCREAGAFLAIRSALADHKVPVHRLRPYARIDRLYRDEVRNLQVAMAKLAPHINVTPIMIPSARCNEACAIAVMGIVAIFLLVNLQALGIPIVIAYFWVTCSLPEFNGPKWMLVEAKSMAQLARLAVGEDASG
jgi:hypothetical protein